MSEYWKEKITDILGRAAGCVILGAIIIYARETPAFMPGRDSAAALAAPVLAPPLNYCYLHIKRNKM